VRYDRSTRRLFNSQVSKRQTGEALKKKKIYKKKKIRKKREAVPQPGFQAPDRRSSEEEKKAKHI
jgi:hypothetical protein